MGVEAAGDPWNAVAMTSIRRIVAPIPGLRAAAFDPIKVGVAAVVLLTPLFMLAATDAGRQAVFWENAHWTISALVAAVIALVGTRGMQGATRVVRLLGAAGAISYLGGALVWDAQVAAGLYPVPAPSDVFFLGMVVPLGAALLAHARRVVPKGELTAVALDGLTILTALAAAVFFVYEPIAEGAAPGLGLVLLAYPIAFLGIGGCAALIVSLIGRRPAALGPGLVGIGVGLNGITWAVWIASAVDAPPVAGSLLNAVGSVATIMMSVGIALWRVDGEADPSTGRITTGVVQAVLPGVSVLIAAIILLAHTDADPGVNAIELLAWTTIALATCRQTLLLRERTGFIKAEQGALDRERALRSDTQRALAAETASETRYRRVVDVFATFGEQLTFAAEEPHMLTAAAAAFRALAPEVTGDILLLNPSRDRLVVGLAWGDGARAIGDVPSLASPLDCLGLRRTGPYLVDDILDPLVIPCPAAAADRGAVLCVPMTSHGQPVGVIHLTNTGPIGSDLQEHAARIAEQLAPGGRQRSARALDAGSCPDRRPDRTL